MKRQRVSSRCTKQCAFSGSPAKPYCSVSSAANSMPSMSCEERRKACGSKRYRLIPRCLTSLHKLGGSMSSFQVVREVGVYHVRVATEHQPLHLYDCLLSVSPSAVGVDFRRKVGFEDRLQHQQRCCHADPIPHG